MQHLLKPSSGATWTKVVASEFFKELLVAVNDAMTASHMGFGRISRASVCYSARKDGRLSKSSIRAMGHLLAIEGTTILACLEDPSGLVVIAPLPAAAVPRVALARNAWIPDDKPE
jgi:hypothetical protein